MVILEEGLAGLDNRPLLRQPEKSILMAYSQSEAF
jgi:hypothetical protein